MELVAIVRRIDADGDANLTYNDFAEFLRPACPVPRPVSPPPRAASASRGASSPLKSSSPMRSSSANRTGGGRASSPMRPSAGASPSRTSPTRQPTLRLHDEDELIHGLKDQCN